MDRPKQGFSIPLADWLRAEFREWAAPLVEPRRLRDDGFFDRILFSYPEPHRTRVTDDEISVAATTEYTNLYGKLASLKMGTSENGEPVPEVVPLSSDAWEV